MRVIRTAMLWVALAAAAPAGAEGSAECPVTDLTPAFWRFWEAARDEPAAEQGRLFDEILRRPYADVYAGAFSSVPEAMAEDLVPRAMTRAKPHEAAMRALSSQLAAQLPVQLALFRKAFPDFQCSMPIYVLFSAGAFDGAVRPVGDAPALMFGIDVIAALGSELSPLLVHELLHVHHRRTLPDGPDALYWALWAEGFATYVSRELNPDLPEQKACCLPAIDPIEAIRPRIAAELRERLDSLDRADYARYFLGGQNQDIPARSGYYLGYLIARDLGCTRPLAELARLDAAALRPLIAQALLALTPRPGCP